MPEMILPGVYIEVRPEGLIVPGQISVGNVGVVGTASKGDILAPKLLSSYADALREFGEYDAWNETSPGNALTLTRALQLAFTHGATTVYGVRVADTQAPNEAAAAALDLPSATGIAARLTARSPGTWANDITATVAAAGQNPLIVRKRTGNQFPLTLAPLPVRSAQTRVEVTDSTGIPRSLDVVYDAAPTPGQAGFNLTTGLLTLNPAPAAADAVTVTFMGVSTNAVTVTLRRGAQQEVFIVADGEDLASDLEADSAWVKAVAGNQPDEPPTVTPTGQPPARMTGGANGAAGADYPAGLRALLEVDAHIVVGAGQGEAFGADLAAHCDEASSDLRKRDRIGVVGSGRAGTNPQARDGVFTDAGGHDIDSDRVVFVAPGIRARDDASNAADPVVTLTGAYAAAAVAGRLAALSPHVSLTNKPLPVRGLQVEFNPAQLAQLVKARVVALEKRQGFRVVKGITTSTNSAWQQITTRRIVDYAKYGVRSSAMPYIGLLNNDRVRGAMHATINSFLDGMVKDEMLTGYQLAVTATREEERQGIARVTMTLRPTFSIDYIRVTMFLE
jgi:hypothetical protein